MLRLLFSLGVIAAGICILLVALTEPTGGAVKIAFLAMLFVSLSCFLTLATYAWAPKPNMSSQRAIVLARSLRVGVLWACFGVTAAIMAMARALNPASLLVLIVFFGLGTALMVSRRGQ